MTCILAASMAFFPDHAPAMAASPEATPQASWSQSPPPLDEANPQAAILAAEKRFQEAEKDFSKAEDAEAKAALSGAASVPAQANANQKASSTGNAQKSAQAPSAASAPKTPAAPAQPQVDPREQAMQGSPETGYAGTWKDPATGDIITSVIAPTQQPEYNQSQNYPIIIEPQVSGSDWSSANNSWQPGWPQWPSYGGDNGYPVSPPMPQQRPMPMPPMWRNPGMLPNNPPPPFPPGYRPLRPNGPGMGWQPGPPPPNPNFPNPGMPPAPGQPGNPGIMPPPPPSNNPGWPPSFQPAPPNAWQPNAPGTPGWVPPSFKPAPPNAWQPNHGINPGFRPLPPVPGTLPMLPGGNGSWENPGAPRPIMPRGGM